MAGAAGEYETPFAWVRAGEPVADTFGEEHAADEQLGTLWGVAEDVAAVRETRDGVERQFTTATIRLRNYPDVVAGDQLRDLADGELWDVLTVVAGDNEIACEVER